MELAAVQQRGGGESIKHFKRCVSMRKVTGYIGALIIVMALMGSVLAGYALNINGTSAVVNDYEEVTDVSGLYSHSQEKNYIEYNPADNYIGYDIKQSDAFTINNPNGVYHDLKYKVYKTATTGKWSVNQYPAGAYYGPDGNTVAFSASASQIGLTIYRIAIGENFTAYSYAPDGTNGGLEVRIWTNGTLARYWPTNVDFSFSGTNVSISFNGNTYNSPSTWFIAPANDGDYVTVNNNTAYFQQGQMYKTYDSLDRSAPVTEWNGEPTYNFYSWTAPYSNSEVFVPAKFTYTPVTDMGIQYAQSSRVNNYPVVTNPENTTVTTGQIDLMNVSASDYYQIDPITGWAMDAAVIGIDTGINQYGNTYKYRLEGPSIIETTPSVESDASAYHSYRLSDILTGYTLPANARTITITFDSTTTFNDNATPNTYTYDGNVCGVPELITGSSNPFSSNYSLLYIKDLSGQKDYLVYNIDTGMVTTYTYDGVVKRTGTPTDTYVGFYKSTPAKYAMRYYGTGSMTPSYFNMDGRPHPHINLTITSVENAQIEYIDITKGYVIKADNTQPVIWGNGYENGEINILFRADDTEQTYSNTLTVSNNTIDVSYNAGSFSAALNSGEPVDIGTWRNILLNIDLRNGKLSALPVKTFNSFTNVTTYNTPIEIGEMVNAQPTNTVTFGTTANSLRFNIYSTSVFMDTYGVVMVNPQLNITTYFTDLNDFYKLDLSNFSIYGDSITVNGVTGEVNGNNITFNDQSLIMKDMAITYADGHAYIEDSHMSIDLGEITDNNVIMEGVWYFETTLSKGYTALKQVYEWNWGDFILDNTQFCVFYIGLAFIGLIVARRFCVISVIDYILFITSIIVALDIQVIA